MTSEGPIARLQSKLLREPAATGDDLTQAAVLVAVEKTATEPRVWLTERAAHLRLHAGEIAFPGGKRDSTDPSLWFTALREAEEEIALQAQSVSLLGYMPPLTTRTGIQVTPCIAELLIELTFEPSSPAEKTPVPSIVEFTLPRLPKVMSPDNPGTGSPSRATKSAGIVPPSIQVAKSLVLF